jgi:hypothetical protein
MTQKQKKEGIFWLSCPMTGKKKMKKTKTVLSKELIFEKYLLKEGKIEGKNKDDYFIKINEKLLAYIY